MSTSSLDDDRRLYGRRATGGCGDGSSVRCVERSEPGAVVDRRPDETITAACSAGLTHGTCHELRQTCLARLREHGMSLEALEAEGWSSSSRLDQPDRHLGVDWSADEYRRRPKRSSAGAGGDAAMSAAVAPEPIDTSTTTSRVVVASGRGEGRLGRDRPAGAADGGDDDRLPGPAHRDFPTGDGVSRRAASRQFADHVTSTDRPAHRGCGRASPSRPTRSRSPHDRGANGGTVTTDHPQQPADAGELLRADH